MTTTTEWAADVVKSKKFHHNNLTVSLMYDRAGEAWFIEIHRDNNNETFNIHGIFLKLAHAEAVYNRITL